MSVKLSFWNVCGLNDPIKHRPFCQWLNNNNPIVGALLETHIKFGNLSQLMAKLCFGWNYASNHQSDEDGRIILIWKAPAVVNVLHQSRQSLTCEVILPLCPPFCYTMIYASNISAERSDLWVELLDLHRSLGLEKKPWILGGDFNQIVDHREHSLAHIDTTTSPMSDFRDCLDQLGVFDLRYQGPTFSWSNHQPTMPIAKELDRLLINDMALQSFPDAAANFLPPLTSDHCPCILSLAITLPSAGSKPFKLLNYLSKHPNFLQVVFETWVQAGSASYTLTSLCWKLKCLKNALRTLNRDNFSKIQERVNDTNNLLQCFQVQALQKPFTTPL